MDTLLALFGRLHPMVLHLPIGVLFVIIATETIALVKRDPSQPHTPWPLRRTLATLLALTALFTALTGWFLAGDTTGDTVQLHRWLGIAFAALTPALLLFTLRSAPRAYLATLGLTAALSLPVGHFGATLTHGEGFLTAPLRAATSHETLTVAIDNPSYTDHIAPIFATHCYSCHGQTKQKGSLAMHTPEDLTFGGESAPAIVPGNAKASEIAFRMGLPANDDMRMPPESKPQPTQAEIQTVINWINNGAEYD